MTPNASARTTKRRISAVALTFSLLASGILVAAASSAEAAPVTSAKIKCVNKTTGFARYSKTGECRRTERRATLSCAKGGFCVVGDVGPGRGRVFYSAKRAQPWGRYLEAASSTWDSRNGDPNLAWCQIVDAPIPGTQGTAIGTGAANTNAMLTTCTSGAATAARAYRGGGKSDWYLPARDELRVMFLRKEMLKNFQLHGYWSSSQVDDRFAWIQDFYSDYKPAPSDKSFANYVRPIRAFSPR